MRAEIQDIAPITSVADVVPVSELPGTLRETGGGAGTIGGGAGAGPGTGTTGAGPGAGGGSVFPPQAQYSILPPLPKPASVRGKSFRVHFWVSSSGRVTRVDVNPQIPDEEYRKRFVELMRQYTFTPAMRPDGTPTAGEMVITITL
jgi:protein TonB